MRWWQSNAIYDRVRKVSKRKTSVQATLVSGSSVLYSYLSIFPYFLMTELRRLGMKPLFFTLCVKIGFVLAGEAYRGRGWREGGGREGQPLVNGGMRMNVEHSLSTSQQGYFLQQYIVILECILCGRLAHRRQHVLRSTLEKMGARWRSPCTHRACQ